MARSGKSSSPPAHLSPSPGLSQPEDIEKVFSRFDADGDGRISASELADALRALGSDASPEAVRSMIQEMDADRDGVVDLREFADFFHGRSSIGAEAELREAFRVYDLDRNGLISAKELHLVLNRLGEKCSMRDCARMIKSVDTDGDGNVNFEEFKKMMGKDSNHDAGVGKRGGK